MLWHLALSVALQNKCAGDIESQGIESHDATGLVLIAERTMWPGTEMAIEFTAKKKSQN